MSKLHRDNAGYVGCSAEETQDPYYSYNKLALPLSGDINSVLREEVTFAVTVASAGGGNKYFIDGVQQATVNLLQGHVYTFDQSHNSNVGHPLRFSYTADGTHGGGIEYTLGVTKNGTPGQSGAYTRIVVPFGLHDLKYYCRQHPGMGGAANVTSNPDMTTFGLPILKTTDSFGKTLGSGNNFDPYAANLVLAVPMNGSNGGTTFTDQSAALSGSGSAKSVQAVNVTTSTSASHYYGSSAYFNTSTSSLSINDSTDFEFGTGDFTLETWIYQTQQTTNQYYVINSKYGTNVPQTWWWATIGGFLTFYLYDNAGFGYAASQNVAVPLNKWTHVAVTRHEGKVRLYQDSVVVASFEFAGSLNNTPHQVTIGEDDNGDYNFVGYMADTRIYKGVAKYQTPIPTGEYGFRAVEYKGNSLARKIGGPVFSQNGDNANINSSYPWSKAFDGTANGSYTDGAGAADAAGYARWTPPGGIEVKSTLRINTDNGTTSAVRLKFVGQTVQNLTSLSDGWNSITGTGILEYIEISNSGTDWSYLCAVEIDGTVLEDGDGSNIPFTPGLVWIKATNTNTDHALFDVVRGPGQFLQSSKDEGQAAQNGVSSFNTDGFDLGTWNVTNDSSYYFVGWMWRAGGASGTWVKDGTSYANAAAAGLTGITSPATLVGASINTTYGFSIIRWNRGADHPSWTTGVIPHGLGQTPKMIITKNLGDNHGWMVYHEGKGIGRLYLNNSGIGDSSGYTALPTSSVFTIDSTSDGDSSDDCISYCWSEVSGVSKFGSYSGNSDNSTVTNRVIDCGFKPAWVMIKSTSTSGEEWMIYDSARNFTDPANAFLRAESNLGEGTYQAREITFVDNGFKFTGSNGQEPLNLSGRTYIFAAFAESSTSDDVYKPVGVTELDITDLSSSAHTITNSGATFQSSVKKFYDGATDFSGNGKVTVSGNDFAFGTGDYTIEMWVYHTALGAQTTYFGDTVGNNAGVYFYKNSANYIGVYYSSQIVTGGTLMPQDSWVHVAAVRNAGTTTVFINGSPDGAAADTTNLTGTDYGIGETPGGNSGSMEGYIQDVRVYKGIAKYTSSFSPPERSVKGTARRYPSGVYVVS